MWMQQPKAAPAASSSAPAPALHHCDTCSCSTCAELSTTFDASTLATGTAYQAAVQNLIEMGFPAEQVARAMKAAYNNPDRAAEYLMTEKLIVFGFLGNPDNIEALAPPAAAAPRALELLHQLPLLLLLLLLPAEMDTNSPEFQQFRNLIQAQPHLLQPMLQQIGQSQPELLRVIQQNPDAFLQLLGEGGPEGMMDFGDDDEEGGLPAGAQTIQITPEENAAIERLTALGFDRNLAAQAYFACDKNEELAANYLFEV
ncbi:XPC-binding-domain-containing protein [Rhizoclosmatium globosum]|uniref:UV excision repair protein RAD23 n=1 Tax=Rhizoclosmatium globosum TaxID=329046 RepID=A0A1Y2C9E7_9FUNG|nr:XPC-binding-domain-containing protein [Rhizoclosmatium globosum]|eukprot:ORY43484.1 XPC-binding-domain-containing protein [Rhizoclosmatium globosum]